MKRRGEMKILDACCGGKMFWYEKDLDFVDFQDNRELQAELCDGRTFSVEPDCRGGQIGAIQTNFWR